MPSRKLVKLLLYLCFALVLTSCAKTTCNIQAVAGGQPYCVETFSTE